MSLDSAHAPMDIDLPQPNVPLRPHPQTSSQKRPSTFGTSKHAQDATTSEMDLDPVTIAPGSSSSPLRSFSKPRTAQRCRLFALTDETKILILSHLPVRTTVGACRAVCQELCSIIDGHEKAIAETITRRELRRLHSHNDRLKAFGKPSNIKDFVEGLRFFTKHRGIVPEKEETSLALSKWAQHSFRNVFPYEENPTGHDDVWAILAADLVQLQRAFTTEVGRKFPQRDRRMKFMMLQRHWDDGSYRQIQEVYELVKAAPVNQPYFPGVVHDDWMSEKDTWPKLRLSIVYEGREAFQPVVPYQSVHLLGLPRLPQDKTFFYYVEKEWVCRELRQGPLSPMLKAGILQLVKIF